MYQDRSTTALEVHLVSPYLPTLDGLRAVAILSVVMYHFGFNRLPADLGVDLFFVLSGMLITRFMLIEYRQTGSVNTRNFRFRRVLRIWPAYYAYFFVVFAEECARGVCWDPKLFLSGLLHVVNYYNAFNDHPGTAIAHTWAVSLLEQFYLLWPIVFVSIVKRGNVAIVWCLACCIALVVIWRSFLTLIIGATHAYLYNAFDTRFDSLAIGCLIASLGEFPRLVSKAGVLVASFLMPLGTLVLLLVSRLGGPPVYHYSLGFTIDSLLIAMFVIQVLALHRHWAWAWLDLPILKYLGRISYSIYLWHLIAFGIANHLANFPFLAQFSLAMLLCIMLASASYWFIERPFLKIKDKSRYQSYRPYRRELGPGPNSTSKTSEMAGSGL